MILRTLTREILKEFKLSADQVVLLELLYTNSLNDIELFKELLPNNQLSILLQNLHRRRFIDFSDDKVIYTEYSKIYVTSKGEKVIEKVNTALSNIESLKITANSEQLFDEFWNAYPATDKWGNFPATRSLRQNKEGCRKKFRDLLKQYKAEDLIKALNYQIEFFKNSSKITDNKMTYFQNSITWLNQQTFLQYLDIMKDEIEDNSMEVRL